MIVNVTGGYLFRSVNVQISRAMEVHVDKQARDFIQRMKDERVSPGDDGTGQGTCD